MASLPSTVESTHESEWQNVLRTRHRQALYRRILLTVVTLAFVFVFFLPIYYWVGASIRPFQDIFARPPLLAFPRTTTAWWSVVISGKTYAEVMTEQVGSSATTTGGGGTIGYYAVPFLVNSLIIGLISTFIVIIISTLTGYALSRFQMRGKQNMVFFVISTRFMPPISVALPLFLMYKELRWIDTYHGLILAHVVVNLPLAVLLIKSFFDDIPVDLDEAAMVDGATRWGAFLRVTLPLTAPGIAAAAVLSLIFSWNEFLLTLYLTRSEIRTIPVAMSTYDSSSGGTEWGFLSAAGSAAMVPVFIFILFVQRHLVRGLTLGAVRG